MTINRPYTYEVKCSDCFVELADKDQNFGYADNQNLCLACWNAHLEFEEEPTRSYYSDWKTTEAQRERLMNQVVTLENTLDQEYKKMSHMQIELDDKVAEINKLRAMIKPETEQ